MGADSPDTWDGSGDDSSDGEGIGMKPIEPGCLAWNRPHSSWGEPDHQVTVICKREPPAPFCGFCGSNQKWWSVDSPYKGVFHSVNACACRLTRIDGGDPDAITETDKEKDHAYTC